MLCFLRRLLQEMNCLQEHFEKKEFMRKYAQCHKELVRFTEMESKDTKLNRALTKACRPVIAAHCEVGEEEFGYLFEFYIRFI